MVKVQRKDEIRAADVRKRAAGRFKAVGRRWAACCPLINLVQCNKINETTYYRCGRFGWENSVLWREVTQEMNFRVFIRTFFLVAVLSAVAFTVYANRVISNEPSRDQPGHTTTASESVPGTTGSSQSDGSGTDQSDKAASGGKKTGSSQEASPSRNYVKENVTIRISALGDVALGQDLRFLHGDSFNYVFEKVKGDYYYFFSKVVDKLSEDDLTIANLETTLSTGLKTVEKYDYGNNYWFNGKPEYANILKAGSIEAANLANNHTYDYGQSGYDATRKALEDAGVEYFGYSEVLYKEIKGIKIGLVGFNQLGKYEEGLDMNDFKAEVKDMLTKARAESDLLIANFHWGKEYNYQYDAVQKELAYLAIDTGADLVLGAHPHVLQPIEKYKGKYIAYSLGNFCFGGVKKPNDYDTAIYQQTFVFDSDNVLQPVAAPTIIPCSVSSRKDLNDYRPSIAVEPQISSVLKKLKMEATSMTEGNKAEMVRLDTVVKDIVIDLKYATADNIVGKKVYESNIAYLRRGTAEKLNKANRLLMEKGYRIKVWDAYRPQKYQQQLYDSAADKYYFADPKKGSVHTRGAALDVTLVDADGNEVDMPSGFDEMSSKAHRTYTQATPEQKENALLLENAMKSSGFIPLQKEWWHFDDTEYKNYPLLQEYTEDGQ